MMSKQEAEIKPKLIEKTKSALSINLRSISNAITRKRTTTSASDDDDEEYDYGEPLLSGHKSIVGGIAFPTQGSPIKEKAVVEKSTLRRRTFSNLFGLLKTGDVTHSQDESPKFNIDDESDYEHSPLYPSSPASSTSFVRETSMVASYFELCTGKKAPTKPFEAANYCLDNLADISRALDLLPVDIRLTAEVEIVHRKISDARNLFKEYCEIVGDSLTDTSTVYIPATLNEFETVTIIEQASSVIRKHKFRTLPGPLQLSTEPKSINILQLSDACLEGCSTLKDFLRNLIDCANNIHCISEANCSTRIFRDTFEHDEPSSISSDGSFSSQASLASVIKSEARKKSTKIKSMPVLLKTNPPKLPEKTKSHRRNWSKPIADISNMPKPSNGKEPKDGQAQEEELFPMTLRGICEKICATDPVEDIRFSRAVLLCFRHWCEPTELVQLLHEIYKDSVRGSAKGAIVSMEKNLLAFLELWAKVYWDLDNDRSALDRIYELLTDIGEACGTEKPVTLVNYCRDVLAKSKVETTQFNTPAIVRTTDALSPSASSRFDVTVEFIDINMTFPLHTSKFDMIRPIHFAHPVALRELAKQLTLLQSHMFLMVDPHAFVNSRIKKGLGSPKALTEFNDFSFKLLCWVEDEILSGKTKTDRTNTFALFTQLAMECVMVRNHEAAHSIYVALENAVDCTAVPMFSSELYNAYSHLGDIFSCFNLPRGRSRQILMAEKGPCIPVFCTFDMRIVKVQEHKAVVDAKSKGKLLDVPDYVRLADIAIEIKDNQKRYAYAEHAALQKYIKHCVASSLDEEERIKKRAHFEKLSSQAPAKFQMLKALKGLYRCKADDAN